jgi:hypothetical protein
MVRETAALERLVEVLQRELDAARAREQAALEREARLLGLLERLQPQISGVRMAPSPHKQSQDPIRQQILALLKSHTEGLSRRQLEIAIGAEKNLTDTLQGMIRARMIVRLAPAFFALAQGKNAPQDS